MPKMESTTKFIAGVWNVDSLGTYLLTLIEGNDKRYEQKFEAQEQAIKVASSVSDKRLDGLNEIRKMAQDQQEAHAKYIGLYIPRLEAIAEINSLKEKLEASNKKIETVNSRLDMGLGSSVGAEKHKDDTKWWIGVFISAIPGLIALVALLFQHKGG